MADTQYRNGRNAMQVADDDSGAKRPESKKSKWERAGLTREEYERGTRQIAQEKIDADVRAARLDRARRGQSNPGNN
jgi:hypothetical protein